MKAIKLLILLPYLMLQMASAFAQNSATVIRVVDGDTYQLLKAGRTFTIRLANVDAPESKQQFGSEAASNVSGLILGKTVLIDSIGKDRYNRTIANITIKGMALDSIMVRNGWAWQYSTYNSSKALAELQKQAINEHLGVWGCGTNNVCPPWVFRNLNSKNRQRFCKNCNN